MQRYALWVRIYTSPTCFLDKAKGMSGDIYMHNVGLALLVSIDGLCRALHSGASND